MRRGRGRKPKRGPKPLKWKRSKTNGNIYHTRAKSFIARRYTGKFTPKLIGKTEWQEGREVILDELVKGLSPQYRSYWGRHRERLDGAKRRKYSRVAAGKYHRPEYYTSQMGFRGTLYMLDGEVRENELAWGYLDHEAHSSFGLRRYIGTAFDALFSRIQSKPAAFKIESCLWKWYRPGMR